MTYLKQHAGTENFMEALVMRHDRYAPIVEMLDKIIQDMEDLSWADAELIGRELGMQNNSAFCTGIREGMTGALEASNDRLKDPKFASLLTFLRKVNETSGKVNEQDVQAVRDAGWSDQTLEDALGLAAVLKVYSILANGMGFDALPSDAFAQIGAMTVEHGGYLPVFQAFVSQMNAAD